MEQLEETTLVKGVIIDKDFSHPQMPKVHESFFVVAPSVANLREVSLSPTVYMYM